MVLRAECVFILFDKLDMVCGIYTVLNVKWKVLFLL